MMRSIGLPILLPALAAITVPAFAQTTQPTPFGAAAPIACTDLSAITGLADTSMMIRAQNSATVANNSVSGHSQTGTISFDAQAFSNLNGLSLLSANTGNNVSINSSLNVNVAIQR